MVHRITETLRGASVFAGVPVPSRIRHLRRTHVFLAPYLLENFPRLRDFVYSPWLTPNLTLDRYPESRGGEPAWDTVFLDSPTLATRTPCTKSLRMHVDRTV